MDLALLRMDIRRQAEAAKTGDNVSMFHQKEFINACLTDLDRHKQKKNSTFFWVIPMIFSFPFNPLDFDDTSFNSDNPYYVRADSQELIVLIKNEMRENKELHNCYANFIGKTTDEYDVSSNEITQEDKDIFMKYRVPLQFSMDTMKVKTMAAGQMGKEFASSIKKDMEGKFEEESKGLLQARILDLESSIITEKVAEYMLDKDKSSLTKDQKAALKTIRDSKEITYPKKSGVMLFLEFEGNHAKECLTKVEPKSDLWEHMKTVNCSADLLKKLMKRVGKKKDLYPSYLILKVTYGDGKSATETEELALYKSREFEAIEYATEEELENGAETSEDPRPYFKKELGVDFDELFKSFNNENFENKGYEKAIKRNIYKFKPIRDDVLAELFKDRIDENEKYICQEIFDKYIDIIQVINPATAERLQIKNKENKLPKSFKNVLIAEEGSENVMKALSELDSLEEKFSKEYSLEDADLELGEQKKDENEGTDINAFLSDSASENEPDLD